MYPTPLIDDPKASRSVMLISTKIPSERFRQIPLDHKDITAIELQTEEGPIRIYNVYNNCTNSEVLETLSRHLANVQTNDNDTTVEDSPMLWLGDFNRHHPMWDELRNEHLFTAANLTEAEKLIDLLAEYDMEMVLPPGTPTLRAFSTGNLTQTDNVFCSNNIAPAIMHCDTKPDRRPVKTDHFRYAPNSTST